MKYTRDALIEQRATPFMRLSREELKGLLDTASNGLTRSAIQLALSNKRVSKERGQSTANALTSQTNDAASSAAPVGESTTLEGEL